MHTIIFLVELEIFLCINVSFIVLVYNFVFVRCFILDVHFVRAVLQPLFVSYLSLICFIGFLYLLLYPSAYIMPIQPILP